MPLKLPLPPIEDLMNGRLTMDEWRAAHGMPPIVDILRSVASEPLKPTLMFERLCWAAWEARERRTNSPDGRHYLAWDKAPDWNGRDEMRMMVRALLTELRTPTQRMIDAGWPAMVDTVLAEGDAA